MLFLKCGIDTFDNPSVMVCISHKLYTHQKTESPNMVWRKQWWRNHPSIALRDNLKIDKTWSAFQNLRLQQVHFQFKLSHIASWKTIRFLTHC